MVKCTNGVAVIEVTEGAYNTIFKDQGYRPIADEVKAPVAPVVIPPEKKVGTPVEDNSEVEEDNSEVESEEQADAEEQADTYVPEEKDEIDSLLEKPIGQWSNDEVKAFAEAKGIDITGTKNAKEAKGRIRKFLEDAE